MLKKEFIVCTVACLVALLIPLMAHAEKKTCWGETRRGENLSRAGKTSEATTVLKRAINLCKKEKKKIVNPYIALGTAYFRQKKCNKAIPQFKIALKISPNLGLGFMNMMACQMQMNKPREAVATGKRALKMKFGKQKKLKAKIHYNMGMAYFNMAAQTNNTKDFRGEKHFKAASKLMPNYGGSYYFLGTYQELFRKNMKKAKRLFVKGCKKGDQPSCGKKRELASVK